MRGAECSEDDAVTGSREFAHSLKAVSEFVHCCTRVCEPPRRCAPRDDRGARGQRRVVRRVALRLQPSSPAVLSCV